MGIAGSIKKYIIADLFRYKGSTGFRVGIKCYVQYEGFRFSVWLRICHFLRQSVVLKHTLFIPAKIIYKHYKYKYGYDIPYDIEIGPGLLLFHIGGVVFCPQKCGKNATVSQCSTVGMTIHDGVKSYPVLGDNIYIAPGSKIIGGIRIGNDVAIGANAVANKDVEDHAVVVGIPGKVISHNGAVEYVNNPVE